MNKQLTPKEIEALVGTSTAMTRADKLLRWARLVREAQHNFVIFHRLEYYRADELACVRSDHSAFNVAAEDPILKDAGLKGDSAADAIQFFELSQDELHEFSCDCGGAVTNETMADRIETLAAGRPTSANRSVFRYYIADRIMNIRIT